MLYSGCFRSTSLLGSLYVMSNPLSSTVIYFTTILLEILFLFLYYFLAFIV